MQYHLKPFVFFYVIYGVTLSPRYRSTVAMGNFGIISPLNCNPMSVRTALNIPKHFITFLSIFILFPTLSPAIKVTVFGSFGAILLAVHKPKAESHMTDISVSETCSGETLQTPQCTCYKYCIIDLFLLCIGHVGPSVLHFPAVFLCDSQINPEQCNSI